MRQSIMRRLRPGYSPQAPFGLLYQDGYTTFPNISKAPSNINAKVFLSCRERLRVCKQQNGVARGLLTNHYITELTLDSRRAESRREAQWHRTKQAGGGGGDLSCLSAA